MGKSLRLVSRNPNRKTGKRHVSSSSDGIVDVAAQVVSGLTDKSGILELLPPELYDRAKVLLESNDLSEVGAKKTPRHELANQRIKSAAEDAMARVIGPVYLEEQQYDRRGLKLKQLVRWIQQQLATPGSKLNRELGQHGYDDLVEVKRSDRWWGDIVAIRSKFAE